MTIVRRVRLRCMTCVPADPPATPKAPERPRPFRHASGRARSSRSRAAPGGRRGRWSHGAQSTSTWPARPSSRRPITVAPAGTAPALRNYLNESSTRWAAADHSDLIFVCMHFNLLEKYLKTTTTSALIVDVCSSKEQIVRIANERNLRMIGGHPMAGNEQKGERGWDVRLFQKTPFFLCPAGTSTSSDRRRLTALLRKLGCKPIIVNPVKHDEAVAITSHLPALIAHSYAKLARGIPEEFFGPGFHSFTRPGRCSTEFYKHF